MDKLLRFSDYDVFAYVASGLGSLVVSDVAFATNFVLQAQWTVASGVLTIAAAYIIGQILAAPSGWLIERVFVRRVLWRPTEVLLGVQQKLGWRRILKRSILSEYYTPLDPFLQQRIRECVIADRGNDVTGEAVFWCAFPVAKSDASAYARMENFLKLYGFCRNMAFIGFCGAWLIGLRAALGWYQAGSSPYIVQQFRFALFALLIGVGMLHRYLKFFRLYSLEVLVTYAGVSAKRTD